MSTFSGNDVVSAILNRRSTRSYQEEQIDEKQLEILLECGFNAPSARNVQPWFLSVVQDKQLLSAFKRGFLELVGKQRERYPHIDPEGGYDIFYGAPTVIFVFGDNTKPWHRHDASFLGQNILLAAESMGIGSCIVGLIKTLLDDPNSQELVRQLKAPAAFEPLFAIILGYKNEQPPLQPRETTKLIRI